jgi:hypothetical protein
MSQNVWATIMPFGPVTNFYALISGTVFPYTIAKPLPRLSNLPILIALLDAILVGTGVQLKLRKHPIGIAYIPIK